MIERVIQKIAKVGNGNELTDEQLRVVMDFILQKTKRIAEIANAASGKTATNTAIVHTLRIVGKAIVEPNNELHKKVFDRIVDEQYDNIGDLASSIPEELGYTYSEVLYISYTNAAVDTSRNRLNGVDCECKTIHALACEVAPGFFLTDSTKWSKYPSKTRYDRNHPFFKAFKIQSYDDILFTATNFAKKKTFVYKFIILYEAQDTSDNSYKLLDTICGTNSFLQTGDPKQTLFGSNRKTDKVSYHLQGFEIYNLTKNFRSKKEIVDYGNIVARQKGGLDNKDITQKKKVEFEKPFFDNVKDSIAMLQGDGEILFVDEISDIQPYLDNGENTYVLASTNNEIETIRLNERLGKSYYDIAPSKVSDNPSDLIPFFSSLVSMSEKSIYENLPQVEKLIDAVGEKTIEKIFEWFEQNPNVSKDVSKVLDELMKQDIPYLREKFYRMHKFFEIRKIIIQSTFDDITKIKSTLLEQVEVLFHNTQRFIVEKAFSKESYEHLTTFIKNFCDNYNLNIKDFIKEFSKSIKEDYGARYLNDGISKRDCKYSISTIHNSKGKEFDNVILIFNQKGNYATIGVNLYVGVTRAKKRLVVVGMPKDFINGQIDFDI